MTTLSDPLDDFNQQASKPVGGRWAKLKDVGDKMQGVLLSAEIRDRTDPEGNIVVGRKSGKPRNIWRLIIQTDLRDDTDDDGIRVFDANEAAQNAIRDALPLTVGNRVGVQITAAAADSYSQATYAFAQKAAEVAPAPAVDDLV